MTRILTLLAALSLGAAATAQTADDIEIEVHIIGMGVGSSAEAQLRDMAAAAGGTYHASNDAGSLTGALAAATGVGTVTALMTTESEPNSRFSQANPVAATGPLTGRIAEEDDVDWYLVDVRSQGELIVTTTAVPEELDLVFRAWTRNKDVLAGWFRPARQGGETRGVIDLPAPGRYWLEVRDGNDDAFADTDYALSLGFTPTPDTDEPNNSFAAAGDLALPMAAPLTAAILPEDDADWYRVQLDHQGELALSITGVPPELDLRYRVWTADREVLDNWAGPATTGGDTLGITDLPAAGSYWIEVRDGNDDARAVAGYTLEARFTPTPDATEPNGRFDLAHDLVIGANVQDAILPEDDVDWYAVTVDHQGALDVMLTDVPPEIDLHYRVWTASKDVLAGWYRPLSAGADLAGVTDLPRPGTYMIEIRDGNDDARSPEPYTLTTAFTPTPDTTEPNGSIGRAQAIAADAALQAAILPEDDGDWYVVDLPQQGALTVSITAPPPELDVVFRVWSANRDVLAGWFSPLRVGGDTVAGVDIPSPGLWYLEVRDGNDDARSPAPYQLALDFAPTADAGEPNDRFGDATTLTVGADVTANILPRRDHDWYVFDVADQGALTVDVTEVDAALDIVLRAWNADKDAITGWASPLARGGPTQAVIDLPRAGRYLLELADGNDDARSAQPYRLSMAFAPTGDATEPGTGPEGASDLPLGQPMQAAIFPEDDRDWFAVTTDRAGALRVAVTGVPAALDLHFRLRTEGGDVITGWHAPLRAGGDTVAEIADLDAGRYVIEVADGNDDARATAPYTIEADMIP